MPKRSIDDILKGVKGTIDDAEEPYTSQEILKRVETKIVSLEKSIKALEKFRVEEVVVGYTLHHHVKGYFDPSRPNEDEFLKIASHSDLKKVEDQIQSQAKRLKQLMGERSRLMEKIDSVNQSN